RLIPHIMSPPLYLTLILGVAAALPLPGQDLREVLRHVDESRGNFKGTGVEWTVSVTTTKDEDTKEMTLGVQSQAGNTLAEVHAPEKSRGQQFLFADGDE